jgi:aspartyl-tRNA(Asn)/glutamyl-tRNA(Gln) amidotransferase subunit A
MADGDLVWLDLVQASQLLASGEFSPLELTRAYLERIDAFDGEINSFITLTAEEALQRAKQAEIERNQGSMPDGSPLGSLHGIPIAIKDLYDTAGVRTTAGSKFWTDRVPENNAVVVDKLYKTGAVSLGKLNMHEIALGLTNVNPHFGPCRNPWDLERVTGGSSGGSGAALAAGLCMGSVGSDTGGSIRVPASLCGVVGLKPTYGRVSLRGVVPLSWNLDHAGPMARSVRDVAMLFQVIAGYDGKDPYSYNIPVGDYLAAIGGGVERWRVALVDDSYFNKADSEILQAVRQAGMMFEDLGAHVSLEAFPDARRAAGASGMMVLSDAAEFHRERLRQSPDEFGEDVLRRLRTGTKFSLSEYIQARRAQTLLRRQFEDYFERFDILLTPTSAVTAPLIEGPDAVEQAKLLTRFTSLFNLTGLPAISLPCGYTAAGLPIGLQIVSRPWAEALILRAAYAYERATEWHLRRPIIA